MMEAPSTAEIVAARPSKHRVDPSRPYLYLVEDERAADGSIVPVATVFLTNRECPFRCLMCDLWKNTTDSTVGPAAISSQISEALDQLPKARQIKLYNSGNFFDPKAIPPQDHQRIIDRVRRFDRVIVENHPRLCDRSVVRFRDRLGTDLEVAMGLETIHPDILPRLNKQMTQDDFARAASFLVEHGISVRAFILLRPPWLSESEGIEWALRSIEFAYDCGVECCAVIPTRGGNGIMERLASSGQFEPPSLRALEETMRRALPNARGRLFADLWDLERLAACADCAPLRIERLRRMNMEQRMPSPVECHCE